jgi:primase-polymerase (primpol)-like protein
MSNDTYQPESGIAPDCIPDELKSRDRWVCWRYEDRDGTPVKIPIELQIDNPAGTSNSVSWVSFFTAMSHRIADPLTTAEQRHGPAVIES